MQPMTRIDPLLLASLRLSTFAGSRALTDASGFFFRRDDRLYVVSSRHVFIDEVSGHLPDRMEIELHTDASNLAHSTGLSILLYRNGLADWRQGTEEAGEIDVAVLEIDREALPDTVALATFTPENLPREGDTVPIGQPLLIPGFPLGFHDGLHHFPVVRHGIVAYLTGGDSRGGDASSRTPGHTVESAALPSSYRHRTDRHCRGCCSGSTPPAWTWATATWLSTIRWASIRPGTPTSCSR